MYIGTKIDGKYYHSNLGNYIATLTPLCATIGYIATRVLTNYNPIAGATFFGAAILGRLMLQPYFHTKNAYRHTRIVGGVLNAALAIFAAVKGTPYVEEGINFVASHLPSNIPSVSFPSMPSISMPSVSSAFAGISETFANLSIPLSIVALMLVTVLAARRRNRVRFEQI